MTSSLQVVEENPSSQCISTPHIESDSISRESTKLPPARNKVRDTPALDQMVSEMLYREMSHRDIEKEISLRHGIKISRETIRIYHKEIYLPRVSKASEEEMKAWKTTMDHDDHIVKAVVADRIALVCEQIRMVEALKKRFDEAEAAMKYPTSARNMRSLMNTTKDLIHAQDSVRDSYEKAFDENQRVEMLKKRIIEAITPLLAFQIRHPETDLKVLLKRIESLIWPLGM
jgi:hypothetical protein